MRQFLNQGIRNLGAKRHYDANLCAMLTCEDVNENAVRFVVAIFADRSPSHGILPMRVFVSVVPRMPR